MALMMGRLYRALRAAEVPDDLAIPAAEEIAGHETAIDDLRAELRQAKQQLADVHGIETSMTTAMHRMQIRILAVVVALLGALFALLKLT